VRGLLKDAGQLSVHHDNLLDIAHVRMVHTTSGIMRVAVESKTELIREPNGAIWANRLESRGAAPLFRGDVAAAGFGELPTHMDHWADAGGDAPSLILNHVGITITGQPREAGLEAKNTHFLTPETETTTHYSGPTAAPSHSMTPIWIRRSCPARHAHRSSSSTNEVPRCRDRIADPDGVIECEGAADWSRNNGSWSRFPA